MEYPLLHELITFAINTGHMQHFSLLQVG